MKNMWIIYLPLIALTSVGFAQEFDQVDFPPRRSSVVKVVELVGPAVVNISTEKVVAYENDQFYPFAHQFFNDFFFRPRNYKEESLGSGIIIDSTGYVLTNEHVILPASRIKITLSDKREFTGSLKGASSRFDLAVIKIDSDQELPAIPLGSSADLMIGESVIAIGNPFGLSHTVTTGVISAVDRTIRLDETRVLHDFIQTDASINPGNSGGPLLNIHGQLIGINTAIYKEAQGIGFAIPSDKARQVVEELITLGRVRKGWLGIYVQTLTARLASHFGIPERKGVIVTSIETGSPGQQAGIAHGDIITQFNGKPIENKSEFLDLAAELLPDKELQITYFHNSVEKTATITVETTPDNLGKNLAHDWLGVQALTLTPQLRNKFAIRTDRGVLLSELSPNGPAERSGLKIGDVVMQVNSTEVKDLDSFHDAIINARDYEEVFIIFLRRNIAYKVTIVP